MRRIFRRHVTRDNGGRPLASRSERLHDDGNGRTHVLHQRQAIHCSGCSRPLEDLNELRGRCQHCSRRGACSHCGTQCQVCARLLCGRCRRGFTGDRPLTVCPTCQANLWQRQRFEDRVRLSEQAFRRQVAAHSQWAHLQSLKLNAAKLAMSTQMAALREKHRYLMELERAKQRAWRYLR